MKIYFMRLCVCKTRDVERVPSRVQHQRQDLLRSVRRGGRKEGHEEIRLLFRARRRQGDDDTLKHMHAFIIHTLPS